MLRASFEHDGMKDRDNIRGPMDEARHNRAPYTGNQRTTFMLSDQDKDQWPRLIQLSII